MHHLPPDPTRPPLLLAVPDTPAAGPISYGEAFGRPGASAAAYYRRRRAAEWALYQRTLPLLLAAVALAGLVAALAIRQVAPELADWGRARGSWVGRLAAAVPGSPRTPATGSGVPAASGAPPASSTGLPATVGSSSTIWPFPTPVPTPTT